MTVTPLYRRLEPEGVVDGDTDDDDDDDGNCNGDRDGDLAVKDVRLDDLAFNEPVLNWQLTRKQVKVYGTELLLVSTAAVVAPASRLSPFFNGSFTVKVSTPLRSAPVESVYVPYMTHGGDSILILRSIGRLDESVKTFGLLVPPENVVDRLENMVLN